MSVEIEQPLFPPGCRAPQHEYDSVRFGVYDINDAVCETFPSMPLMARGLTCSDGERRVEQQDTLMGPILEVAVSGLWYFEVLFQFLVHVV